jgi:sugar lactone lactonase YvrE
MVAVVGVMAVVLAVGAGRAEASTINLDNLNWSVQYMIDQSQTVLGVNQFSMPRDNRGLAISPDGQYLYAGYNNPSSAYEVRKIDLSAADYTAATVAHLVAASRGKAIAVDDGGRVFLGDATSIKIYDANLTTLQHTITISGGALEGVATVREGSQLVLYNSDRTTGYLSRWLLTEAAGAVTGAALDSSWGSSGQVSLAANIRGVEVDSAGRIWVAGYGTSKVYVVSADGLSYQSIDSVVKPMDIGLDGSRALVTQYTERKIGVFDTSTLSLLTSVTVPWAALELDSDGQSGGGALSGIVVLPGVGFYVTNEAGQTADEKSTYGRVDDFSGWLDGKYYTALTHDDNDPILYATPEPATLSLLAVGGVLALLRRRSK